MRGTLLKRCRTELEQSKHRKISDLTRAGSTLGSQDHSIDVNQITQLIKETSKIEFTDAGGIQTSSQTSDHGWVLHHKSLKIEPLNTEQNRFAITLSDIHFVNKKNLAIPLAGELRFTVIVEKNRVKLEVFETNNPILDAIVMGENLGPFLSIIKRRFSKNDLTGCENAIKKSMKDSQQSAAQRLSFSAALTAIEAIHRRPSSSKLDTAYQEKLNKWVFAAWELFHQTPDNFTTALERYFDIVQEVKRELIEADPTGTLNTILRRHEEEISTRLVISEIDTTLLANIQTLMTRHGISESAEIQGVFASVEETRLKETLSAESGNNENFEHEATFKNPNGYLRIKALCLEGIRKDLKQKLKEIRENKSPSITLKDMMKALKSGDEKSVTSHNEAYHELKRKEAFYELASAELEIAIQKINHLLYFRTSPIGNPLVSALAEVLPKSPKTQPKTTSLDVVLTNAKTELTREHHEAQWQQFLRRWFQPLQHQQAQFKLALGKIADENISLTDKLSKIDVATNAAIQNSKLSVWALFRTPDVKVFHHLRSQVTALCAVQAFSKTEIPEAELITTLENCGFSATAQAFQTQFNAHELDARAYQETLARQLADAFKEPEATAEMPTEKAVLQTRTQIFARKASSVWAERKRTEAKVIVDSSPVIVPETPTLTLH